MTTDSSASYPSSPGDVEAEISLSLPPEVQHKAENSQWSLLDPYQNPWSIELIRVMHSKRNFKARCWRIFPAHYSRRWRSDGALMDDSIIDGRYWCDRGDGGHGTFHLFTSIEPGRCCGEFSSAEAKLRFSELSSEFNGAPLEWIKLGSRSEEKVLKWLKRAELTPAYPCLPRKARPVLDGALGRRRPRRWLRDFGYGTATSGDLTIIHALERLRRNEEHEAGSKPEHEE